MSNAKQSAEDLAILGQLNLDYNQADQASVAERFRELRADGFMVQTPGVTRDRNGYLEYVAKPRPFKDRGLLDAKIRILGDAVLIRGDARCTVIVGGSVQEALYTDAYQKREGTWLCVAARTIAPGA